MGHSQVNTLMHNQKQTNSRVYPELFMTPTATEQEATYYAALELVARIDDDLTRGTRHYRNKDGILLTTLDEVVRAILENDLLSPEVQVEAEILWETPQELAA
jgi:hypothetical protein